MKALLARSTLLLCPFTVALGCLTDEREILETPEAMGSDAGSENAGDSGLFGGSAGAEWQDPTAGDGFDAPSNGGTAGKPNLGGGGQSGAAGKSGTSGKGGTGGGVAGRAGAGKGGDGGEAGSEPAPELLPCPDLDRDGVADCEQTLVKNPSFVSEDANWQADSAVAYTWHSEGATNPTSAHDAGSVTVANNLHLPIDQATMAGIFQCVRAEGGRTYALFVQVLVPEEQGEGSGGANVLFFDTDDCSGKHVSAFNSARVPKGKNWVVTAGTATAPVGVRSLAVRLVAVKSYRQPTFSVRFDDVLIRPM